jgi:hypothetical protein
MKFEQRLQNSNFEYVFNHIKTLGASPEGEYLNLPTRLGPLKIRLEKDGKSTVTAFCRFYDPACISAFGLVGNRATGKWNHFFMDTQEIEQFLNELERFQ